MREKKILSALFLRVSMYSKMCKDGNRTENHLKDGKRPLVLRTIWERVLRKPISITRIIENVRGTEELNRGRAQQDKDFLIYDEIYAKFDGGLMVFAKGSLIDMFCLCNVIMVDKTLKTRPMIFSQVYVVMGKIEIAFIND